MTNNMETSLQAPTDIPSDNKSSKMQNGKKSPVFEKPDENFLRQRNRRSASWHTHPAARQSESSDDGSNDTPPTDATSSYRNLINWPLKRSFSTEITFPTEIAQAASRVAVQAEELVLHIWNVVSHHSLPHWLKDNEWLVFGHRPQLNSFRACFKSIFRIHTETVNIWTHLIGFMTFLIIALSFLVKPGIEATWEDQVVFGAFFLGAILCLGFSWLFHTLHCHSEKIGKIFNKLDYCGIALLTIGSFVPWLYYSFYCQLVHKIVYVSAILVLGTACIVISLMDKFASPNYRPLRAGVFIALGLSGVVPCVHYIQYEGLEKAISSCALGWLFLMAFLYIAGALIYALRIPERYFPGKFDIWFQSHQIFHVFVVAAALVHFYGISILATYRLGNGGHCSVTS